MVLNSPVALGSRYVLSSTGTYMHICARVPRLHCTGLLSARNQAGVITPAHVSPLYHKHSMSADIACITARTADFVSCDGRMEYAERSILQVAPYRSRSKLPRMIPDSAPCVRLIKLIERRATHAPQCRPCFAAHLQQARSRAPTPQACFTRPGCKDARLLLGVDLCAREPPLCCLPAACLHAW